MRTLILLPLLALAAMNANAQQPAAESKTALVIHGGAGYMARESLSAEAEQLARADLQRALDAGNAILQEGGTALDAVQAAIVVLEDSPRFNAGKGAVFNARGGHELDASIMEGHTRRAGAVAGVTTVRSPITLARAVMEHSPHVMLAGEGAEAFADSRPGIERVPNAWFDTDRRREALDKAQRQAAVGDGSPGRYFGTVGAVALDQHGHIAAATSTGGMTNKKWGRIGDSPVTARKRSPIPAPRSSGCPTTGSTPTAAAARSSRRSGRPPSAKRRRASISAPLARSRSTATATSPRRPAPVA